MLAVLAILAAGANMPSPLYSAYQQRFAFSDLTLTAVYAVYALVGVLALLASGRVGDRLRPRRVLRSGVALAAAGTVCLGLASSLPWLVVGRLAYGLALATVTGVGMALIVRTAGGRGAAATAGSVAFLLGSAGGPTITGLLAQLAPAPLLLPYAVQLVLLVAVFVGLGTVREHPPRRTNAPRGLPLSRAARRALLVAATNGFLSWTVTSLFLALLPTAVERALGTRDVAISGAVAGAVLGWAALTPAALRHLGARRGQVIGLVAMIAPLLILGSGARSLGPVAVAGVLAGLAHGLLFGGAADHASSVMPTERASGLTARVNAAFYLGAGLPTLVAGIATTAVSLDTAVSLLAGVALLGCLAMIRPTHRATTRPTACGGPVAPAPASHSAAA